MNMISLRKTERSSRPLWPSCDVCWWRHKRNSERLVLKSKATVTHNATFNCIPVHVCIKYVCPLTERSGHVALPLSAQFVRSACVCALTPIAQAVKHETMIQCWANADPPSATLAWHQTSTGSTLRVCWVSVCHSVL